MTKEQTLAEHGMRIELRPSPAEGDAPGVRWGVRLVNRHGQQVESYLPRTAAEMLARVRALVEGEADEDTQTWDVVMHGGRAATAQSVGAARGTLDYLTRGLARFCEVAEAGGFEVGEATLSFDDGEQRMSLRVSLGIEASLLKAEPDGAAGPSPR